MPTAYYDGQWVEKSALRVGVTDFGFARGLGIFELARVYGGVPFRLDDHLARLQNGVSVLGLTLQMDIQKLRDISRELCAKNKFSNSCLKYYFTAGDAKLAPQSFASNYEFSSHLMIYEDEVRPQHPEAPYGLEQYQRGYALKVMPHERSMPSVKSINYMQGFVAALEAGPAYDDILFTHRNGYVTESTRSNFFCVIDGVLCTPEKDMLFGITRKVVLEIAQDLKVPAEQRTLMPADIAKASEAFITGSVAELVPVRSIDKHMLATTMDGPVFSRLRKAFSAVISSERLAA